MRFMDIFRKPSPEDYRKIAPLMLELCGLLPGPGPLSPVARAVLKNGVETRKFADTRHDN